MTDAVKKVGKSAGFLDCLEESFDKQRKKNGTGRGEQLTIFIN